MRILVAEDDRVCRQMMERKLTQWGYEVSPAEDGEVAWQLIQNIPPDLVIADWMMPGRDGLELCQAIREAKLPGYVYIIIVTARDDQGEVIAGLEAGADDYVTKPPNFDELRMRIRAGERIIRLERSLAERVQELEEALTHVRRLRGLLPICAHCKRIRDDDNYWHDVELYIAEHSDTEFTHGICPECLEKVYGRTIADAVRQDQDAREKVAHREPEDHSPAGKPRPAQHAPHRAGH